MCVHEAQTYNTFFTSVPSITSNYKHQSDLKSLIPSYLDSQQTDEDETK